MRLDRLSGGYCGVESADQSERAANGGEQSVENPAVRDAGHPNSGPKARSAYEFAALPWFTGD
jgi:hypothetical protein